jgi:hypothetical protein
MLASTGVAHAAAPPVSRDPLPPPADQRNYTSPKIDDEYTDQLKKLPDWNGQWLMQAAPKLRPAQLMFDPEHYFQPSDIESPPQTGPLPGSYLTDIPLKPEYKAQYMKTVADTVAGKAIDQVAGGCKPYGMLRVMGGQPSGPEITMTPEVVFMFFDFGSSSRRIYIDGRGHPRPDEYTGEVAPRWNGHSIGKWEGDTLVVDTVGIFPNYYDQTNPPFSDKVHVTERIRLVAWNWLENQITVEDPVMLTRPWTVTRLYRRSQQAKYPNTMDNDCSPNDFIDVSSGYQRVVLPSESAAGARATHARPPAQPARRAPARPAPARRPTR